MAGMTVEVTILDTETGTTCIHKGQSVDYWVADRGSCDCHRSGFHSECTPSTCERQRYLIVDVQPWMPAGYSLYDFNRWYPPYLIRERIDSLSH